MRTVEQIDETIVKMIDELIEEYGRTGWLSTPSDERKVQIATQIGSLRASLNPECTCKKK